MNVLLTLLRVLFGAALGFLGCLALLNAPYQLLNKDFKLVNGGPLVALSLLLGGLLIWAAWRLISKPPVHLPAA